MFEKIAMKPTDKPKTYEAVPFKMVLSGIPIPAEGVLPSHGKGSVNLKKLSIQGITTPVSSVGEAERYSDEQLRHCRYRVRCGNPDALLDLLKANPAFILDSWVREKFARLAQAGRLRPGRGRPAEQFTAHPLIVAGLVKACVTHGFAKNVDGAFAQVAEWTGFLSRGRVKALYYQAYREERFRAILIQYPELARPATAEEVSEEVSELHHAETLRPGGRITRTVQDPQLGTVEITFEAKDKAKE